MAIQMKRGRLAELDTSLLKRGEIVVATDTDYVAYAKNPPTDIVQLSSKKDVINAIENGTLIDVEGTALIFKKNRSQPTLSLMRDYVVGTTYDVEYGDGLITLEYGLQEFLKCIKPKLVDASIYDKIETVCKKIYREQKSLVRNTDLVYVYCYRNDSPSANNVSISVYHGQPRQTSYTLSSYSTDVKVGNRYFWMSSPYVVIDGEFTAYTIQSTGEYTKNTQETSYTLQTLGKMVDARSVRVSNLGMKTDRVINKNDWEWDFSKCQVKTEYSYQRAYDLVDGLWCTLYGGTYINNGELVIPDGSAYANVPYIMQLGRTVEIEFGECDRYHGGASYPSGTIFGIYLSSSSSYGVDYDGLEFNSFSASSSPKARLRSSFEYSEWVDLDDPNRLSNNKIISRTENNMWQVTIVNQQGLSSVIEFPFVTNDTSYSRIGKVSQRSGTSYNGLYITRIKKIKIK